MAGVNKVILVGNLGQDPEIKILQGGNCVANFSLATSEKWKDKTTGQMQEKTEWHKIVAWGKLAEICGKYLKKGSQVYVEGKNQTTKFTGKDGVVRYTTEVVIKEMAMVGGRPQQSRPSSNRDDSREIVEHDQSYGDTGSRAFNPDDFHDDDTPF